MFNVGFVISLKAEAQPLLDTLSKRRHIKMGMRDIYTGIIQDKKVCVIISGCGKIKSASATQYLIDSFPAKFYVHYGTAGAISDALRIGDIIVADQVIEHDVVELFPNKVPPPIHKISTDRLKKLLNDFRGSSLIWGPILSGDEDIVTTKRKKELLRLHEGLSVDWESAGFALTCQLNKAQGYVFRGISDYAYEHTTTEYEKNQALVIRNILQLFNYLLGKDYAL